jgi:hypothetical protein
MGALAGAVLPIGAAHRESDIAIHGLVLTKSALGEDYQVAGRARERACSASRPPPRGSGTRYRLDAISPRRNSSAARYDDRTSGPLAT